MAKSTEEKIKALKKATRYIYSQMDFGDFGGCGDVVSILLRAARLLKIPGVKIEYGYIDLSAKKDDQDIAHAWLLVDGQLFDPSAYYHKFTPLGYDPFDETRPEEYQSDLFECIVGTTTKEQSDMAREAVEYVRRKA